MYKIRHRVRYARTSLVQLVVILIYYLTFIKTQVFSQNEKLGYYIHTTVTCFSLRPLIKYLLCHGTGLTAILPTTVRFVTCIQQSAERAKKLLPTEAAVAKHVCVHPEFLAAAWFIYPPSYPITRRTNFQELSWCSSQIEDRSIEPTFYQR